MRSSRMIVIASPHRRQFAAARGIARQVRPVVHVRRVRANPGDLEQPHHHGDINSRDGVIQMGRPIGRDEAECVFCRAMGCGPVYRDGEAPDAAEIAARVDTYWRPYHAALAQLLAETRARFGFCLLIDCHSMPAHPAQIANPPDFVLGDAHGTACAPRATRLVEEVLLGLGYRVRRNDPYAGGYVTRHYGRPRDAVHALQIEINRSLYMDEKTLEPHSGFVRLTVELAEFIEGLTRLPLEVVCPSPGRFAAE